MTFSLANSRVELRHVNFGKEGSGDDMASRFDLKFLFMGRHTLLATLFGVSETEEIFWTKDKRALPGINKVTLHNKFLHNLVVFGDKENNYSIEISDCTVAKITLQPVDSLLMGVSLTVQAWNVPEHTLKMLTDMTRKEYELQIDGQPDLFAEGDEDED